jgi:hypothetical protein
MTHRWYIAVLSAVLVTPGALSSSAFAPGQQEKTPKKEAKQPEASLSGCVDEQDGRYVLTGDKELKPIANLEADGFPQEGFAKHLGHKVTVRGTSIPNGPLPTFRVRSIVMVSETCAPQR